MTKLPKSYDNIPRMERLSLTSIMRYWLVFIVVLLASLIQSSVLAIEVKDLYVAKVEVASQSKKDRDSALKQALQSVLVKVGGQKSVLTHPDIRSQLNSYQRFVTNYRYEKDNGQQFLRASFDQAKINQVFVDANLPIWGSLRPQVVLWMINEQGLVREIITAENTSSLVNTVSNFSEQRGLPIVLPQAQTLVDNVSASDVWGRFKGPIFTTSAQFYPEAILIIRISDNTLLSEEQIQISQQCQLLCQPAIALDWSYISTANNDATQQFSQRYYGSDRDNLLNEALGDITEDIYQRYALTTDENNQFELDVANVDSLARYVQISDFLQQLSAVQSVKLIHASGTKRRFSLTLLGSKQSLLASLKLSKMLKQYIDPLAPVVENDVPVFYWEQQ